MAAYTSNGNTALDANGTTRIGYGFSGSGNNQNRTIQQFTLGSNTTLWRDAKYGALNLNVFSIPT